MEMIRIALMTNSQSQFDLKCLLPLAELTIMSHFSHPQQFGYVRPYDIIIVDTAWVEHMILDRVKTLRHDYSQAKIITISPYLDVEQSRQLMQMGVTGLLLHDELDDGFEHFVKEINSGRIVISPNILKELVSPSGGLSTI
jgi:DNA-binding NarL/FixJ family response regulator